MMGHRALAYDLSKVAFGEPAVGPRYYTLGGVAQAGEEGVNPPKQAGRMLAELARRDQHIVGQRARLFGGAARACHVLRDLAGAGGGLLDAARDLPRRRILLLDGGGDGGGDAADVADGLADVAHSVG